jgi:L-cysteine desulfidase
MKLIKKIIMNSHEPNIIEVDGQKFIVEKETHKKIDGIEHLDKVIFKEFDENEYNENLKTVIDAIADNIVKKELIKELVKDIDLKTLRRLAKRIESGKAIKKQQGCLGFKIGDAYLQLIE